MSEGAYSRIEHSANPNLKGEMWGTRLRSASRPACTALVVASLFMRPPFAQSQSASRNAPQTTAASTSALQSADTAPGKDPSAPLSAFEIVSIKPDKSDDGGRFMITDDGISADGFTVHILLLEALGISENQLFGEPGWLKFDRFNIEAKVAAGDVQRFKSLKMTEQFAMLLPIFEGRFGLKFHRETKDLTQYVLVVAKGGLKMKAATPNRTYPDGTKMPDGKAGGSTMRSGPGELIVQAYPIDSLARFLSFQLHSPVLNKTVLTGKYDVNLSWMPNESEGVMMGSADGGASGAGNPGPSTTGPSLFSALQEQLGLKLELHKEPREAILIDHIEQPSAN